MQGRNESEAFSKYMTSTKQNGPLHLLSDLTPAALEDGNKVQGMAALPVRQAGCACWNPTDHGHHMPVALQLCAS